MVLRLSPRRLLLPVAVLTLFAACGKDEKNPVTPVTATTIETDSLQFMLGDSVLEMGSTSLACCGLYDPSFVNERAMRVLFYDPAGQKPGWQILILIDHAQQGETVSLPTVVEPPSKIPRISMFATTLGNDVSSNAAASTGTITVHSFRCTSVAIHIDFSVDAVLGSELGGGGSITVQGTFRATFPPRSCS
jgi:hypothetical protein